MLRWRGCLVWGLAMLSARAAADDTWITLSTPHFELFTDAGDRYSPGLLVHLEQLRSLFLAQAGAAGKMEIPIRIFAFRSAAEYVHYRKDEWADAYYYGAPGRDYIVMPLTRPDDYRTAAHEYAHAAVHGAGLKLPLWLSEGIAEVFSTVTFQDGNATVGATNPGRMRALQHGAWMPLEQVTRLSDPPSTGKDHTAMFYAECWALTHMLMFSPEYSQRFGSLLADRPDSVFAVYGMSPGALEREVRAWISRPSLPSVEIMSAGAGARRPVVEPPNAFRLRSALAELQFAIGQVETARRSYQALESSFPANADVQVALGRIALATGKGSEGLARFGRAMSLGIKNAQICYEFAVMAQDAGLPEADVVTALERSVELNPGMDDARYLLALDYMNSGQYRKALQHFQALRFVPQRRAYAYYSALAHTQTELGMRDDANRTAAEARKRARTEEEADRANQLAWMASSEIVVQMTGERLGQLRRVPTHSDVLENWNPFIEPGDQIEHAEGVLRDVDCSGAMLRLTVEAPSQTVVLGVPQPERVQLRPAGSGPLEFTCGSPDGRRVLVEYAQQANKNSAYAGTLRGIRFLQNK